MRFINLACAAGFLILGFSHAAAAQGTGVAFGAFSHNTNSPVEVSAESLSVDQTDGTAVFSGNVVIGQGDMRISAGAVRVHYMEGSGDTTGQIARLEASGGVILVSGAEEAEAREAIYTIETGVIVMTGDVILTQGQNALSANKMTVNLKDGTGVLEGRVRTVLQTGGTPP